MGDGLSFSDLFLVILLLFKFVWSGLTVKSSIEGCWLFA
jgi:hypothetical protein